MPVAALSAGERDAYYSPLDYSFHKLISLSRPPKTPLLRGCLDGLIERALPDRLRELGLDKGRR